MTGHADQLLVRHETTWQRFAVTAQVSSGRIIPAGAAFIRRSSRESFLSLCTLFQSAAAPWHDFAGHCGDGLACGLHSVVAGQAKTFRSNPFDPEARADLLCLSAPSAWYQTS